ncbi:type I glyceraldehyde-3-phosphate dehydrogenase [Pseudonocardia sp. GCM10023141]|uniref:type I glyceraldehyde-3-phosphate dehydrogenase n=1 Tax=Pseudonocardia sp. GCM10023141 TaxID=3252653 RepID=UPI00361DB3C2
MTVGIGINGMGRIGRAVVRSIVERPGSGIEVLAVNDVAPNATLAHLLQNDSTHGRWSVDVAAGDRHMTVGGRSVRVFDEATPAKVDWRGAGVDIVIEATGRFCTRERAAVHIRRGSARKVVIAAPATDADATIVMGCNESTYDPARHDIVSGACGTTHCAVPMVQVLNESFGLTRGLLTTVHSYTADQRLLDGPHQDLRLARSAAANMVPTSTGAVLAVPLVLPELAGRIGGAAVRVPVEDVSLVDLTAQLTSDVSVDEVNQAFATAADGRLKAILRYTDAPVVSRDVLGERSSCVLDSGLTLATGNLVKVFGWFDNEWGYAQRTMELAELIAGSLPPR